MNRTLVDLATDRWLPQPKFARTAGYAKVRIVTSMFVGVFFTVIGLLSTAAVIAGTINTTNGTGIVRAVEVPKDNGPVWLRVSVPNRATLVHVSTDGNVADFPIGSKVDILIDHNANEGAVDDVTTQLTMSLLLIVIGGLIPFGFAAAWRARRRELLAAN